MGARRGLGAEFSVVAAFGLKFEDRIGSDWAAYGRSARLWFTGHSFCMQVPWLSLLSLSLARVTRIPHLFVNSISVLGSLLLSDDLDGTFSSSDAAFNVAPLFFFTRVKDCTGGLWS